MFGKLAEAGLINYRKYSGVTLTEEGQRMADELARKHETLKEFLWVLGVPEDVADGDACVMEHNVSAETLDRLTRFVDFVHLPEEGPIWLLHFREYYETGEAPSCSRDCLKSCVRDSEELMKRMRDVEKE
jgi:DtxR family Mn-dependent transcriptional regulator